MDDDFNTPQALAALFDLARLLYTERDRVAQGIAGADGFAEGVEALVALARVLGLLEMSGSRAGRRRPGSARPASSCWSPSVGRRGDGATSERPTALREELRRMGVVLEDTPGGTSWKVRS